MQLFVMYQATEFILLPFTQCTTDNTSVYNILMKEYFTNKNHLLPIINLNTWKKIWKNCLSSGFFIKLGEMLLLLILKVSNLVDF